MPACAGMTNMQMSRPKTLLLLIAASLITHLPGITNPLLDHHAWAQTLRASLSRNYFEGGMNLFKPRYDYMENEGHDNAPQFPLYSYLVALLYKVFGFHETLGRVLSAVFAAFCAVFLYLLAARFLDEKTSFLSGLVFCFIPIRIYFMRTFMPEAMAIFCLVAGFYFFLLWMREDRFLPHGIASSILLTFVPLLKIAYLWLLLPPLIYAVSRRGLRFLISGSFLVSLFIFASAVGGWYGCANFGAERSSGFV